MDIIEKIRQKGRKAGKKSPLDFLFSRSNIEEPKTSDEAEEKSELLNINHLGEVALEELTTPVQKEIIELNTENPNKIRYLKLIVALLESSNYDAAISAIMELSEGSCGSERSHGKDLE